MVYLSRVVSAEVLVRTHGGLHGAWVSEQRSGMGTVGAAGARPVPMDLACLKSGTKDGTVAHRGDAAASASVAHKVHGKLYRSRRTFLASQMQLCSSLVLEMASPRCMAVAWTGVA